MDRKRGVNNSNNRLLYDPNQRKEKRLGAFSMEENSEDDEILEENETDSEEVTDNLEDTSSSSNNVEPETTGAVNDATAGAKGLAKETAKTAVKQAGKAAGTAAKKVAGQVAMKIAAFIAANPWVLAIIGIVILLLFFIIMFLGSSDESGGSTSYLENCSEISISATSLSRSEFVSKVQEYFADSSDPDRQTFAQNADKIYTIATNNGVNPELVVIRAMAEGFSPGASKNNYWGMGCTNTGGYNACITYSSFDEGVLKYVQNI